MRSSLHLASGQAPPRGSGLHCFSESLLILLAPLLFIAGEKPETKETTGGVLPQHPHQGRLLREQEQAEGVAPPSALPFAGAFGPGQVAGKWSPKDAGESKGVDLRASGLVGSPAGWGVGEWVTKINWGPV